MLQLRSGGPHCLLGLCHLRFCHIIFQDGELLACRHPIPLAYKEFVDNARGLLFDRQVGGQQNPFAADELQRLVRFAGAGVIEGDALALR